MKDYSFVLCGEKAQITSIKGGVCFANVGVASSNPFEVYNKLKDCDKITNPLVTMYYNDDREQKYYTSVSVPVEYAIELYEKEHNENGADT